VQVNCVYQGSLGTVGSLHSNQQWHPFRVSQDTFPYYDANLGLFQPPPAYPRLPIFSQPQKSPTPMKQGSQSPYLSSQYNNYPYPPPRRQTIISHQSYSSENFSSEESREKGRCTYPECGKVFKDLKAHMLTHQTERPGECPFQTCDYHIKGFARKYDKTRHTLTHYKGTMVCGFCPGSGSTAEKSFHRADVFKRHLTSAHAVEQTPPNSRKKATPGSIHLKQNRLASYASDATGRCSTCSSTFSDAQDLYDHLDDCVLRIVNQEEPTESINARRLAEVEQDPSVLETLSKHALPSTTINSHLGSSGSNSDDEGAIAPAQSRRKAQNCAAYVPFSLFPNLTNDTQSTSFPRAQRTPRQKSRRQSNRIERREGKRTHNPLKIT
jgi:hypothetical protein